MGNEQSEALKNLNISANLQFELQSVFERLDTDKSGQIEQAEIIEKFKSAPQEGSTFKQLLSRMDTDKNGTIDKTEFMLFWKQAIEEGRSEEQVRKLVQKVSSKLDKMDKLMRRSSQGQGGPNQASTPAAKDGDENAPAGEENYPKTAPVQPIPKPTSPVVEVQDVDGTDSDSPRPVLVQKQPPKAAKSAMKRSKVTFDAPDKSGQQNDLAAQEPIHLAKTQKSRVKVRFGADHDEVETVKQNRTTSEYIGEVKSQNDKDRSHLSSNKTRSEFQMQSKFARIVEEITERRLREKEAEFDEEINQNQRKIKALKSEIDGLRGNDVPQTMQKSMQLRRTQTMAIKSEPTRKKVNSLDENFIELQNQVINLKFNNQLFESSNFMCTAQAKNPMFNVCVEIAQETIWLKRKKVEAVAAVAKAYKIESFGAKEGVQFLAKKRRAMTVTSNAFKQGPIDLGDFGGGGAFKDFVPKAGGFGGLGDLSMSKNSMDAEMSDY